MPAFTGKAQLNLPELKFELEKTHSEEELIEHAMEIVQKQESTWQACDWAVIVFVPSIGLCMELVENMGWYH